MMAEIASVGRLRGASSAALAAPSPTAGMQRITRGGADKVMVVLVDPRPLTRASVVDLLSKTAREFAVSPASSAAELTAGDPPEDVKLVVLNVGAAAMGDAWVNAELESIARQVPRAPLIVLADSDDAGQVAEALRRGVRGYIPTTFSPMVAVEAMRLVHAGGTFVPASALRQLNNQPGNGERTTPGPAAGSNDGIASGTMTARASDGREASRLGSATPAETASGGLQQSLTPRQREVLRLLCEGKPNKIIAHALSMQEGTVKVHVRQIMKKLKATNRTQVAFFARRETNGKS